MTSRNLLFLLVLPVLATGCFGTTSRSGQISDPCAVTTPATLAPELKFERVPGDFSSPVFVTHASDKSQRLFVVEQTGTIRIVDDGKALLAPFLDLRDRTAGRGEQGLLSMAFHPQYAVNGRFYVNYTRLDDGATVISEYQVSPDPDAANPDSERILLVVEQPFANHNGGQLQFGPDGYLYIGMGDGGSGGDPLGHGQNLSTLLGSLLRIDVIPSGGSPYRIPPDNPFITNPNARAEIFAYGFRNPWRFSFDRCTGQLFLADVGQNRYEEVDLVTSGGNYGWSIMEGNHCYKPASGCALAGLALPIAEYAHGTSNCSVTGGYVYRGTAVPDLIGHYLFGDFCSGRIWSLRPAGEAQWEMTLLKVTGFKISSFGEDETGELYVADYAGAIYRIVD